MAAAVQLVDGGTWSYVDDDDVALSQTGVALTLCQQLASAMGPSIKQCVRVLGPGIISNFGDSKVSELMCVLVCRVSWWLTDCSSIVNVLRCCELFWWAYCEEFQQNYFYVAIDWALVTLTVFIGSLSLSLNIMYSDIHEYL